MMESIELVCGRFSEYGDKPAVFWQGKEYSYNYLHEEIGRWEQEIEEKCTRGGMNVEFAVSWGSFPLR